MDDLYKNRTVKKLNIEAEKIELLTKQLGTLTDEDFLKKTAEFKSRLQNGEDINKILPEAYALVYEAIHRKCGFTPHRVQLMGAISIFEGNGVEMKTGEGKTITAIFPAYLNSLTGEPVHIMTSNDYLAHRDAETVKPIFDMLGITVGAIDSSLDNNTKREIYKSDVVYGTTANFGFDFLKDNLVYRKEDKMTRGLGFAIIDEADSLLLDQAKIPLILSNVKNIPMQEAESIKIATAFVNSLTDDDVKIDNDTKKGVLSSSGIEKAMDAFGMNFDELFNTYLYYINNAITAKYVFKKDVDYIVENNKVVLIDQNTARPLPSHKLPEGIHQAVESKENVSLSPQSKIYGRITIQNFLKRYNKIAGMSGTIKTSEEEFRTIYGLEVVQIPTNKPMMRKDDTRLYHHAWEKYIAIIHEIRQSHEKGQPVLIGTTSIEESEKIRSLLEAEKIDCEVLNAKNLSDEAKIIANAGRLGSVTIATDMAGRGTDIKLGGNAEILADAWAQAGLTVPFEEFKEEVKENRKKVIEVGGLKVIGASVHDLIRNDGQLRGRAGRQGEIGESIFFTSLEDPFFKKYPEVANALSTNISKFMREKDDKFKNQFLEIVEKIQAINESRDYDSRKNMLIYDSAVSEQYDNFYDNRDEIIESEDISKIYLNAANVLAKNIIEYSIESSINPNLQNENNELYQKIIERFGLEDINFKNVKESDVEPLIKNLTNKIFNSFDKNIINKAGRTILLKILDDSFMDHLKNVEVKKSHLHIESIGSSNPLLDFNLEIYEMYKEMYQDVLLQTALTYIEKIPQPLNYNKINVPTKEI